MPSRPAAPNSTAVAPRRGIARWKLALGALVLLIAGLIVWQGPDWKRQAEVGAAYGARMGCSCRYVQGRDIASCATDAEPGMEIVGLEDLPEERAVRASVPLLASRTARFAGATGCVLVEE